MDIRSNLVALLEPWSFDDEVLAGVRFAGASTDVLRGVMGAEREFADQRYALTREQSWQVTRARTLAGLLGERGVPVWISELPSGL